MTRAVDTSTDKDRVNCRRQRAGMLARAGKIREAEKECLALLKENKESGEEVRGIRVTLSDVYSLAKEHAKSEQQLKLILDEDSNDALANNNLGYQWAERNKNLAEAERIIRKAIALDREQRETRDALGLDPDRDNAAYVDSLGWVLFRRGKLKEARKELEKAAELPDGKEDPVMWDHLGDVYARLKQTEKAIAAWQKALGLYDVGARTRTDDRYRDIQGKLRAVKSEGRGASNQ
jgi:tetratricopeptide (TPR) repeat protein